MSACVHPGCERAKLVARGLCRRHYGLFLQTRVRQTTEERFWSRVNKAGAVPEYAPHLGPCWEWTAGKVPEGYGTITIDGRITRAHRYSHEQLVAEIPEGLFMDHLCRNRGCVNPSHLEPVTPRENALRAVGSPTADNSLKTHCPSGHSYDEQNTYWDKKGRQCRACARERGLKRYYARKRSIGSERPERLEKGHYERCLHCDCLVRVNRTGILRRHPAGRALGLCAGSGSLSARIPPHEAGGASW